MQQERVTQPTKNVRVGTPKYPADDSQFAHLSQKERMIQGYPHLATDPVLAAERRKAQKICRQLKELKPDEVENRYALLKEFFHPDCKDKSIWVEAPFTADYGYNIKVGNNFYANFDCVILDSAPVEIGDDCLIAPGVHIYTAYHPLAPQPRRDMLSPNSKYFELASPVKIGHTCWIGGKAIICPGVTIGDNVVIGAGSVVTKDVPSNVVVAGNPAKIIRYLDGAEIPPHVKASS